ncbi:PAS domain-containing protein [Streptomyces viridochromogenes]|uniref:PAS domain-containing protein n=1 Tax=Streptomyces viridochromogenes TaxID=1938 RepID=UPI000A710135
MNERVTHHLKLLAGLTASFAVDARGVVTAWSRDARELLGYEPVEVMGTAAARLLAELLPASVRRCWAEREAWASPLTVLHPEGHPLRIHLQAQPLLGASGEVRWFATVPLPGAPADSLTSADGVPATSVLKQWALEQLPLPMALFDRQGLCLAANTAMTRIMGKPEAQLIGVPLSHSDAGRPIAGLENLGEIAEQVWRTGEVGF